MCEICELAPGDDPVQRAWAWQRVVEKYRAAISRQGWMITYVPDDPPLAYTSGLHELGSPELVTFAACQDCAAAMLNALARRVKQGSRLRDGGQVRYRGTPLKLFEVPNPDRVLLVTHSLYARSPDDRIPALQVVFPDAKCRWPWEPDYAHPSGGQPMPGTFRA